LIGCTPEEYYEFYKAGYQAVNEANEELGLAGDSRVLVGGPVVTGDIVGKMDLFMWLLVPEKVGIPLNQPVRHPTLPAAAATELPILDFAKAFDSARAEAEARIERDGARFHVVVSKSQTRPGVTFAAPARGWSVAGLEAVEATVRNTSTRTLNVHLVIDGPGADRTHRRNCKISSETIPPGEAKTLVVPPR
jgi:hypothetical protein